METWKVRTEINDVGAPNRVFEEHWLVFGDKWLMPHDDDEWTKEELEAIAKKLNDQGETAERLEKAEKEIQELRGALKFIRQAYEYEMLLGDMQKIDAILSRYSEQTKP